MNGIAEMEGNYPSKGVGERGAWFRDSEGNVLAIGQAVQTMNGGTRSLRLCLCATASPWRQQEVLPLGFVEAGSKCCEIKATPDEGMRRASKQAERSAPS